MNIFKLYQKRFQGKTTNNGDMATTLNNVKLTVYDSTVCKDVAVKAAKNWNSQICAGDTTGVKAICNGQLACLKILTKKCKKFLLNFPYYQVIVVVVYT